MVKCTVITTAGRKSDLFAETKTPKDILEYFDIDYSAATNTLDGERLNAAKMNTSLRDLGVANECRLSSIVKIDNAAKLVIAGAAAVLTSDVKLADWNRIQEMSPEALTMVDEDEEPYFKVAVGEGPGTIGEYGIEFANETTNQEGKATVTVLLDPEAEDKIALVKKNIGPALLNLIELEKEVPDILKEIEDMEKAIDQNIVLM